MNNGAFGENFPYSNFHDLNMDWIIKIAKDFLDQYTGIQNVIDTGLSDLESKYEELEGLLTQWYETHSEDIATELTRAIAEFATEAEQITQEVIATIPEDYSELAGTVAEHTLYLKTLGANTLTWIDNTKIDTTGRGVQDSSYSYCSFVMIPAGYSVYIRSYLSGNSACVIYNADRSINTIYDNPNPPTDNMREIVLQPINAIRYARISCLSANKNLAFVMTYPSSDILNTQFEEINLCIKENHARNGIDDMNSATPNMAYTVTDETIDNLPSTYNDINIGTVLTYNGDTNYANGTVQMFTTRLGQTYCRILWNDVWSDWMDLSGYGISAEFAGIEMFRNFAVIGDSFANGRICTASDPNGTDFETCKWRNILTKLTGVSSTGFGWSGCSTYTFTDPNNYRYNIDGFGKLLTNLQNGAIQDLYFLCLGINDSNSSYTYGDKTGGLDYLGTSADINLSDYTQNANSFWGNYGKIIQAIKGRSNKIKLVISTVQRTPSPATSEAYDAYNSAIRQIGTFFSIPVLELKTDSYFISPYWMNRMVGYHPTAPQYAGMAKAINRVLSNTIAKNYDYFKEYKGL